MSRPKNKQELLNLLAVNFDKLLKYIAEIPAAQRMKTFPKGFLNRNIKDVLAHLHEWHNMFLKWYEIGMSGGKPDMPQKGYTWKTLPELNKEIWKRYKDERYEEILKKLMHSHEKVYNIVNKHLDEELFTKKKYKWTGSTSLGAYLVSSTSSHYDWAEKLIKKCTKLREDEGGN